MKTRILAAVLLTVVMATAGCEAAGTRGNETVAKQEAVVAALAPSLVRVEYTLRIDKGEPPMSGDRFYRENRPGEATGFLVTPTEVITVDRVDFPRFVENLVVRLGGDVVKARFAAWAVDHQAAVLELERPLVGGKPLLFDPHKGSPYLNVTCGEWAGMWTTQVQSWSPALLATETGRRFVQAVMGGLIADDKGVPIGLSMDGELPPDNSWKGSPLAWKFISADDRDKLMDTLRQKAEQGVIRVTLHFRSPAKEAGVRRAGAGSDEGLTEMDVPGILLEGNRLLVIANLKPKVTARLERIVAHSQGQAVEAKFAGSLSNFGCLMAMLDKALPGAVTLATQPFNDYENRLLAAADLRFQGENRTTHLGHRRIMSFRLGWERQEFPQVFGRDDSLFLFDTDGLLVALPIAHREQVATEGTYPSNRPELSLASYLKTSLDNLPAHLDKVNVPLSEEDEHRLAWLGVELQPLTRDLARENKVSELTRDGAIGGLISYVYPNSPAAKEGIEPGAILLRLRVTGQPKPLEVSVSIDAADREFPWEALDELPEKYYDRVPTPWPSTENSLTRALTDFGFGAKFTAEFLQGGKTAPKDFVVTAGPINYDSAPRYKCASLGITVRDMTYEVRRYLQKTDTDPGVVISKEEPGGKASVAGAKPYEIITHINDTPVMNVKQFEDAVNAAKDEIRLSVKRLNTGRVVKIKMTAGVPKEAGVPSEGEKLEPGENPPEPPKPTIEKPKPEEAKPAAVKPGDEKPAVEKPATEKPAVEAKKTDETPKKDAGDKAATPAQAPVK
jgi:hypothetical protein